MQEDFTRRLCLSVDVQGYGKGNDVKQSQVQEDLSDVLDTAARAAGLNRDAWIKQSRGDEELALIPASEPEHRVLDAFISGLATELYRRNCVRPLDSRLRLRLAITHGPVCPGPLGFVGKAVVEVSRLIDSDRARQALANVPEAHLLAVLSHDLYTDVVVAGRTTVPPSHFVRVHVEEKEFAQDAWMWMPGVEVEALRHAVVAESDRRSPGASSLASMAPVVDKLRATLAGRFECDSDTRHTLDMFSQVVELVDANAPLTAYGDVDQLGLAYVLAELSIIHNTGNPADASAEFRCAAQTKRDMDLLAEVATSSQIADFEVTRRLVESVSLTEPERLKRATSVQNSPVARCFSLLWAFARLTQLLDMPGLMGTELPPGSKRNRNIVNLRAAADDGRVHIDLAVTERSGFHLAAEAQHMVRRYLADLEDLWRRSHLIAPTTHFELHTPGWGARTLQVHEVRVDPRPITRLLMGRALYGDRKHVWLRELIQNAVDATELGSHRASTYVPRVEVELNGPQHVTVRDNGVGMTYQQIPTQLAVLGRSGWRDSLAEKGTDEASTFFGRFGIGFASVFSVASLVEVQTRTVDARPAYGIAVQFSGPDRPFYTDFTQCPVGTEIRISLSDRLTAAEFREAMSDFFAYLPPSVTVTPDLGLPASLAEYSSLTRYKEHCKGRVPIARSGMQELGPYRVGFKIEILHHPKPHKRKDRYSDQPQYSEMGNTAITYCVDGVRVKHHRHISPDEPGDNPHNQNRQYERDLHLSGCYITVDFGRDNAPVTASRNALDLDEDLQRNLEQLVHREVSQILPDLAQAVRASCITARDQHNAVYAALSDLLVGSRSHNYWHRGAVTEFHPNQEVLEAAASAYRNYCPVQVSGADGKIRYIMLNEIAPEECAVAIVESLSAHAAFPAFVRATDLSQWIVVGSKHELSLLEQAWPHDTRLRLVDEAAQLYEDFQAVLPEIREGKFWRLLRADYALAEGTVFGASLTLQLPGKKRVARDVGLVRRRFETSATERPRVILNRRHDHIAELEKYLKTASEAKVSLVQDWFDRLCKDVLDEKSLRAANAVLPKLYDQLTEITGIRLIRVSAGDLKAP
ncbi:ATP-binding protein [Amycolatopsis sp. lyj-346]|uniref:ATP-binding protein n=1 Tax=Amycolatopsis sp. lyj-346 TaxID=2789289 RepID=UPI00397C6F9F